MSLYTTNRGSLGKPIYPVSTITTKKPNTTTNASQKAPAMIANNGRDYTPKPSLYSTPRANTNIVNQPAATVKSTSNALKKAQAQATGTGGSNGPGAGTGSYSGGSGGAYSPSTSTPAWTGPSWKPKLYTAQELADLYGIAIDQQTYANQLNAATDKYFRQLETQRRRSEQQAYDLLAENYELTRNDIKAKRQEALKNGMSSGQLAAQELSTLFGNQTSAGEIATDMVQTDYDLAEQEATTLEENYNLAFTMAQEALANLSNLSQQIYSIDTQRYAADAAGAAQIGAADISAYGQIASANASAAASRYAADRSAAVQELLASPQYQKNYFDALYDAQYRNQSKYYTNRN